MPDYLTLFQFGVTSLFASSAVVILVRFHWLTAKKQAKLSMQLQIHLRVWLLYLTSSLIYLLPLLYFLCFPSETGYNTFFASFRGALHYSATNTVGLSTMFTAIDRIFILLVPTMANSSAQKLLNYLSITAIVSYSGGIFVLAFFQAYLYAGGETTTCLVFFCMIEQRMNHVLFYKVAISIMNLTLGCFFAYLFFGFERKTMIRREKKKNYLVFWLLVTELFFTIIPAVSYLITDVLKSDLSLWIGYCIAIFYSLDGFTTACIYWRIWLERTRGKAIQAIVVPSISQFSGSTQVCNRQLKSCTFCIQPALNNKV